MASLKIGIDMSQHQLTWDELVGRAQFVEEAGFESGWVFDHFKPLYGDPAGPCLEAWTLLAALAASTSRLRLGALVTGVTYRHPSVLAAEAVTVDHVSGGRLNLGIGAAWFEDEHHQLGLDFPPAGERADRLEEALTVMKLLMTGNESSFSGRHYRLSGSAYHPLPVQRPHPPIWVGAGGEKRMLAIAARHADVWHGFGPPTELARKSALVDQHAEAAGRDPASIERSTSLSISEPWEEVLRTAEALAAAGFSHLVASWPAAGRPRVEEFATEVVPRLVAG